MEEESKQTEMEKAVLPPDHPVLERFQKALKQHLLEQIERAKDFISDNQLEYQKKTQEKDVLGVQTYELEQVITKQQNVLENIVKELDTVNAAKEEIENVLEEKKNLNKELQDKYIKLEKENRNLHVEVEAVNYLNSQIQQWEQKLEEQIIVNKRISSKTKLDINEFKKEKIYQDMLIYLLHKEVWKFEDEVAQLNLIMQLKEDDIKELEKTVAIGNTNLEALQAENRCLMHAWNSVVVAISNRDKNLENLNSQHTKLQEQLKGYYSSIEQLKKLIKNEMIENEKLTMFKKKIQDDMIQCETQTKAELNKKLSLEKEYCSYQSILEQTEKDINVCKLENFHLERTIAGLSKDFNKVTQRKFELEQEIIRTIEHVSEGQKMAKYLLKILHQVTIKRREVEVLLEEAENKQTFISSQIQEQKFSNEENKRYLEEVHLQQMKLHKEADRLQSEKDHQQLIFKKRERQIHLLVSHLEKSDSELKTVTSPQKLKIIELEKGISTCQETIWQLQSFWLREQKNLLRVSNQRQEQINQLNLLKKKAMILEQKNLKLSADIEAHGKKQERIMSNINNLQNKCTTICELIFKKRNQKIELDRNYTLIRIDYDTKLKDIELKLLQIKADITELEEDKVNIAKEILEVNREILEWEKKLQLTKEVVNMMKEDQSGGGEILNMKMEIHKMELIYGQMKKAQEKLSKDMTYCLSRRDSIYYTAEAQTQKNVKKNTMENVRSNYLRKLDDVKNKIQKFQNDIKETKDKIELLEKEKEKSKINKADTERRTILLEQYAKDVNKELEEAKTNRQFRFELLLIKQKKLSMYHHLSLGRKPYMIYRKEEQLSSEYKKQKELNSALVLIVNRFMSEFTEYYHEFNRMNNSLKIAMVSVYPRF